MKNLDPHCSERSSTDECCSTVLCDNDAEIVDLGKLVNQEIVGNRMTGQLVSRLGCIRVNGECVQD